MDVNNEITTAWLFEWLKSKTWQPPEAGKNVKQQECSFISGRNSKWYRYFGRQYGTFLQS